MGSSNAWVSLLCLDVDVFFEEKPTPLRAYSAFSNKKIAGTTFRLGPADSEGNTSHCGAFVQGF